MLPSPQREAWTNFPRLFGWPSRREHHPSLLLPAPSASASVRRASPRDAWKHGQCQHRTLLKPMKTSKMIGRQLPWAQWAFARLTCWQRARTCTRGPGGGTAGTGSPRPDVRRIWTWPCCSWSTRAPFRRRGPRRRGGKGGLLSFPEHLVQMAAIFLQNRKILATFPNI